LPLPDPRARWDGGDLSVVPGGDALAHVALRTVFQPVVWVRDGTVAAVEAFARGPEGTAFESPRALLDAARRAGRLDAVDRACARRALESARSHGLDGHVPLVVNVTGASFDPRAVRELAAIRDGVAARVRVILDLAEPDVACDPLGALALAMEARRRGIGIALDDLGPGTTTLALLPLLRPDIVRLDVAQLRGAVAARQATVVAAVGTFAEATGALVVAERVDDADDLAWASTAGAHAVQGRFVGAERALIDLAAPSTPATLLRDPPGQDVRTPFGLVEHQGDARAASVRELVATSRHLERWAGTDEGAAVLAVVDRPEAVIGATAGAFADLATRAPLVAVFGPGLASEPAAGVTGVPLPGDDALRDEWAVVVIGAQRAGALIARRSPDARTYDAVVTYRREVVVAAARLLLARL
jgi:EAL domain-containing protein (putative c-di-GMP-specific phosphodiesterase class I)